MKKKTIPQEIRGTIPWGWLIGLALLIVAAGVTLLMLPKPTPHTAPPPIVRAKIPPAPEPPPQPPADATAGDTAQATEAGDIAKESAAPDTVQDDAASDAANPAASTQKPDAGADSADSNVNDEAKPPLAAVAPSKPSEPGTSPDAPAAPASSESAAPTEDATAAEEATPSRERPARSADDSTPAGEKDEAEPAAAAPAETDEKAPVPTQVSTFQGYTIQVGAYRNKENADAKMADLQQRGYAAYLFEVTDARKRSFYMVRFGQFEGHQEASETLADFKEKENMQAVIVRAGSM